MSVETKFYEKSNDDLDSGAGSHPELAVIHGTGVIFHTPNDRYMFFRRENKPDIPFPGRIALIGGRSKRGEWPVQTICREVTEELFYRDTGEPFVMDTDKLIHVDTVPDGRPGVIDVFSYELDFEPDLVLGIREGEGEDLVVVAREEALSISFPYDYHEVVREYVRTYQSGLMANYCLEAATGIPRP